MTLLYYILQNIAIKNIEKCMKIYYLNESSLEILNRAKDLSNLIIKVEAFNSTETGIFCYNSKTNEFYLYEQKHFLVRNFACSKTSKCPKGKWDTCVTRYSGEKVHSFECFLQICLEGIYELIEITEK